LINPVFMKFYWTLYKKNHQRNLENLILSSKQIEVDGTGQINTYSSKVDFE
jgi:hypothetical protein